MCRRLAADAGIGKIQCVQPLEPGQESDVRVLQWNTPQAERAELLERVGKGNDGKRTARHSRGERLAVVDWVRRVRVAEIERVDAKTTKDPEDIGSDEACQAFTAVSLRRQVHGLQDRPTAQIHHSRLAAQ